MPSHKLLDTILLILGLAFSLLIVASLIQLIFGGDVLQTFHRVTSNVIYVIFGLTIFLIIVVLMLENSSPVHTLAWIMVLIFVPVVGFILYLFFGRNWRKIKLFNRKEILDKELMDRISQLIPEFNSALLNHNLEHKLHRLLRNNGKAILTGRNQIELISDTGIAFSAICDAIKAAQDHVHLVYFSIASDSTGNYLKNLLIQKAKAGIEVRFIYDDVACWKLPRRFKRDLILAGVKFIPFMPVWIPFLNSRMNYRNHRKLVVIDGKMAFLGGLNIGDQYLGKDPYYGYWRDSVAIFEGEAVLSMQAIFMGDWYFVSKENLFRSDRINHYLNREAISHIQMQSPVQILASGPDTNHASILQFYFSAIANAHRYIMINTPYLILNEALLMALKTAAISGVKVQIILPGKADHWIVFWGSRSYFEELLEVSVEIYEYQRGFMHAKIMIIDDEVLGLGTANMDLRSFNHNFELTALVYSDDIVKRASEAFYQDLAFSKRLDLEEFRKRGLIDRSKESLCRLFSPLL
ncbi:MAG: cardiolipin synthase [Candidatus Cloacimonetes bacterium]|nr:cardiolipin synthase [Candidatus Cloacimonadota bacterium]MDY0337842.1 cardiolipin synthase [Candidatus Cloacimonadaceae bacterium]MCB5268644.1 cardiolipin synthase [Candidatus Cloacimonadota bacterium]MCK9334889.1 cardiolipin synthase [Candidatus Cloacimonadota bacterium]MDD2544003.1 cardiolipin synthase [Candidatus Cloacimonadota bacterium]